jgi:hypothetical protein
MPMQTSVIAGVVQAIVILLGFVWGHSYVRDIMYHQSAFETICRKAKTAFIAEV